MVQNHGLMDPTSLRGVLWPSSWILQPTTDHYQVNEAVCWSVALIWPRGNQINYWTHAKHEGSYYKSNSACLSIFLFTIFFRNGLLDVPDFFHECKILRELKTDWIHFSQIILIAPTLGKRGQKIAPKWCFLEFLKIFTI